ncbi:PREDICTED: cytochrome c oxidase subunit NDUFA4-like [Amphimedon queenslandica]|uniref:NADH dehydrogenase [ubiquinone] 1 alpha subcomplex subunit 4 n=1 Tax=Amphimedon queenslandica TaxID=400682 RepID=A0A1X7U3Q1_AMPQE|nr:PREDICTED: cytochrome c oxidase subunit NDUFA4-like [Amphimedon queenslandica]|eukprot:XP_003389063.1 PREDICTED: cytochrome c oxidase subunit NDUFA4-like [Amphimedon queenslandica]
MSKLLKGIRAHPEVIPLIVITGFATSMATFQTLRACNKYPDVSFRRHSNPHPWLNVNRHENLKYVKIMDYSKRPQADPPKF